MSRHAALEADLVGAHGGLGPDGHRDVVIDVVYDGAILALRLSSATDSIGTGISFIAPGQPTKGGPGAQEKHGATLVAYEGGRALDEDTLPLSEGPHRLTLRVSSSNVRLQTPWRIFALRPDCTYVEGPSIR